MRILRIADVSRARAGGISRFMLSSGAALARRGVDVDELFSEDLGALAVPAPLRRLVVPWLIAWRVLVRAARARRPDVVEIHEPLAAPYALLSRLAPRLLPACVVMSHGLEERGWAAQRERWRHLGLRPPLKSRVSVPMTLVAQSRIALRSARGVVVLSTQDAGFLTGCRRIAPERVVRVNGGADAALLRAERSVGPAPRLLFVGSWIDRKGVPELCAAWCRLRELHPDLALTIAGTGVSVEDVLDDFAPACRDGVTVIPTIDDTQLLELLTSHDIFVLPSWFEGMPLSMIEAAAAGMACVVTSICGNVDLFRAPDPQSDGALLIAPHSADAVFDAVAALAGDAARRERLGRNARRRAASFTWDHTAEQLLGAYDAARARASAPVPAPVPDTGPITISVVIATHRRPAELLRCLAAIDAQTHAATEVVVVLRPDDDLTWAAVERAALASTPVRTVTVTVAGVVAALNAGLDAASGAIVAITDDDAVPRTDWLARIHGHARSQPDVGAVGGRDWIHPSPAASDAGLVLGRVLPYGRVVGNHHLAGGGARDVDVLKGVNLALRRAAFDGIRLDERLRGEGAQTHWELALCLALRRAGWRLVYDPAVAVDHFPAARTGEQRLAHPSRAVLAAEVHNETYVLLRWLPWHARSVAFGYGLLVGTRRAPGLLVALEQALRGERAGLGARLAVAQRARLDALGTARAARRARIG